MPFKTNGATEGDGVGLTVSVGEGVTEGDGRVVVVGRAEGLGFGGVKGGVEVGFTVATGSAVGAIGGGVPGNAEGLGTRGTGEGASAVGVLVGELPGVGDLSSSAQAERKIKTPKNVKYFDSMEVPLLCKSHLTLQLHPSAPF